MQLVDRPVLVAAIVAATLLSNAMPSAAATAPDFTYTGALQAGQTLDVSDVNGDVRITNGRTLSIVAKRESRTGDPNDVKILVEPSPSGLRVCVRYPNQNQSSCSSNTNMRNGENNSDTKVTLAIQIPTGVDVHAATVNGLLDVRTDGSVSATTVNGSVRADGSDVTRASSVNGDVIVRLLKPQSTRPLRITTVNGSVRLELPTATRASFRAKVLNGDIVGLGTVERPRYGPGASARLTSGDGEDRSITLNALNGTITVVRT